MIDERHEELASLYAFDLLEGAELAQFEAALARDPELQALVRELRQTSASLAFTAPASVPPPALRQRVLDSIAASSKPAAPAPDNVIRPSFGIWNVVPWAAAACFAIGAAWLGQRYIASQSEVVALRDRNALVDIAVKTAEQQLEAERIITRRQFTDLQQQLSAANTQLADARTLLGDRERLLADARNQLVDRDRQLSERERLIAEGRALLGMREQEVATLTRRVDTLAGASAEIGRQLGEAKQQVAKLTDELKAQGDLANLKITALASMLKNNPKALAVAVWDPKKQEGILSVENLPALAANEDYQLWVVDPQYPNPVDGGVFTVEPTSGQRRVQFKAKQPVSAVNAFAVTRERKGGVPKAEGPFVLLGK
jgi:anti-sigma-K factor RskA